MKRIIIEGSVYYVEYKHFCRFRKSYYAMCYRTTNENMSRSDRYIKRGITTCQDWLNSFKVFFLDMYEAYCDHVMLYGIKETTLDRINNDEGYSKSNCRWATQLEQVRNRTLEGPYHKNKK